MEHHLEILRQAIQAVRITSPRGFNWFGKAAEKPAVRARGNLPAEKVRAFLTHALQGRLYEDFYCPGAARAGDQARSARASFGRMDFVETLSRSNAGACVWDGGWILARVDGEHLVVVKNGLSLKAEAAKVKAEPDEALREGASVAVQIPNEQRGVSPGFYMAVGQRSLVEGDEVLRLYFNLQAKVAPAFLGAVTTRLNAADLAFKFKLLNDDGRYDRCDSAVLYLRKADFTRALPDLRGLYKEFGENLGAQTPAFTKPVARGIGLAESPPIKMPQGLESFGMNRCRLVAEGLVEAFERKLADAEGRIRIVVDRFTREGVCIATPYLNHGSADDYADLEANGDRLSPAPKPAEPAPRIPKAAEFLEIAYAVGRSLARTALWDEGRCTWMAAQPPEVAAHRNLSGSLHTALGPNLYSGTAGTALFLAELFRATGDAQISRTAAGAARQALRTVGRIPPAERIGLYVGWTGVALALVRVGETVGDDEVFSLGAELALATKGLPRADSEPDLLRGRAGAIAALITLHGRIGEAALLDQAQVLADELIGQGKLDTAGRVSWPIQGQSGRRNLTGFSHGTAGVAYSLLKLYGVTRERRWRDCALSAFAYETSVYEEEAENWPDFRSASAGSGSKRRRHAFATYWCHGAPGIALSRILAAHVVPDMDFTPAINAALRTTRAYLDLGLQQRVANFSLCHGLAGNADILLEAFAAGRGDDCDIELVRQVGAFGAERYGEDLSWPCDVGGGINQSLMLGLAGVGHFYLRLADQAIPSVLAP